MEKEKTTNKRVAVYSMVKCPSCGAWCHEGHDDNRVVHCACCNHSFLPDEVFEFDQKEYESLIEGAKEFKRTGWIAYKKM